MNGILAESGVTMVAGVGASLRTTLCLTSVAPGRKIEISVNSGKNFFEPELDADYPEFISVVLNAAVTDICFTGAPGDEWEMHL